MAGTYTYTFGGALPNTYNSAGVNVGAAQINGIFTVNYDATQSFNKIVSSDITVNGQRLPQVAYQEATNASGVVTYRPLFSSSTTNTASSTFLTLTYNGQTPTRFVNVELNTSSTDYSTFPTNTQYLTYQSQQIAVTSAPVCFSSGSLIRTARGDIAVENLRVGDLAVTASGAHRPIGWLGHRHIDCSRHPRPEAVWPVRVLANAFGDGLPMRDLWLSPDHAVQVTVLDPVLIPVKHLINDATIAQVSVSEITYWHVELDSHDILLAENLPAESFLDTGIRSFFANEGSFTQLHPDFSPLSLDDFCNPLVQAGPIVDAVRIRLLARARALGWSLTSADDLHLVADGAVIRPEREGQVARFVVPAECREVRLQSRTFVPERVQVGAGDGRRLGVPLRSVTVIDAYGIVRSLPIHSNLFSDGFSFVQASDDGPWRWTTGSASLPAALWVGCEGTITIVVGTATDQGTLQAWLAPTDEKAGRDLGDTSGAALAA